MYICRCIYKTRVSTSLIYMESRLDSHVQNNLYIKDEVKLSQILIIRLNKSNVHLCIGKILGIPALIHGNHPWLYNFEVIFIYKYVWLYMIFAHKYLHKVCNEKFDCWEVYLILTSFEKSILWLGTPICLERMSIHICISRPKSHF